ncbi:hypothetical protein [Streptomyces sp. NPDC059881]|uniref:hypothetical protein n=1 Tax=Streptomyces sp. NPDC059881 TaxID=3346986 RepID=UPI003660D1FC
MQTIFSKPALLRTDVLPVLAGMALTVSATGAALALAGLESPLRAPFALFCLTVAPAAGLAAALRPLAAGTCARITLSSAGAILVDLLVAWSLRALDLWSTESGVTAVAAITFFLFVIAMWNRPAHFRPRGKKL